LAGVSRRRLGYKSCKQDDEYVDLLKGLAAEQPRYGCRRLLTMLPQRGRAVNLKPVRRLCRKQDRLLKQKRRKKRLGIGIVVPCKA
jgi:hypothetical protein